MDNKMFCFQCEQAAHCTGCTGSAGVCGKSAETANLQDELTGALIGLARAAGIITGCLKGFFHFYCNQFQQCFHFCSTLRSIFLSFCYFIMYNALRQAVCTRIRKDLYNKERRGYML